MTKYFNFLFLFFLPIFGYNQNNGLISEVSIDDYFLFKLNWKSYDGQDTLYYIIYRDMRRESNFSKIEYKGKINDFYNIFATSLKKPVGTTVDVVFNQNECMIMKESKNKLWINSNKTYFYLNMKYLNKLFNRK